MIEQINVPPLIGLGPIHASTLKEGNLVLLSPYAPGLLRGIYKDPEKYEKTYWGQYGKDVYFTSDRALMDKNGLIRIVGRADDVIKAAGHRITTGELEANINNHPEINESAVIGVPDPIKGEVPLAFVVYNGKKNPDEIKKEVIGKIRKGIAIAIMTRIPMAISFLFIDYWWR